MSCYQLIVYAGAVEMPTRLEAIMRAKKLKQKLAKIQALKRSYAFRLAAIVASDNRKGKVWS